MIRILINLTKNVLFLNIILACLIIACGFWVTQEWKVNSATLPEIKTMKPWTANGYEPLTLTNANEVGVNWQSSTPPVVVYSEESFLQKNVGSVILYYTLYHNLSKGELIYYGKTEDGNLVLYKEILSSDNFIHGSNYYWKIHVNDKKGVIEFFPEKHPSLGFLVSSCFSIMFCGVLVFLLFLRLQYNKRKLEESKYSTGPLF